MSCAALTVLGGKSLVSKTREVVNSPLESAQNTRATKRIRSQLESCVEIFEDRDPCACALGMAAIITVPGGLPEEDAVDSWHRSPPCPLLTPCNLTLAHPVISPPPLKAEKKVKNVPGCNSKPQLVFYRGNELNVLRLFNMFQKLHQNVARQQHCVNTPRCFSMSGINDKLSPPTLRWGWLPSGRHKAGVCF